MEIHPIQPINRLLAALPSDELSQLLPLLNHVPLVLRQIIHVRGRVIPDILFIEQGIASLTVDTFDGNGETEVGLIGREGIVGSSALLEPETLVPHRAFVQVAGAAYRIGVTDLLPVLARMPTLRNHCFAFINRLMAQTAQVAGCNVRHTLTERMARWLLMTRDRLDDDNLPVTQEFLAVMLGVRRGGVSLAASTLQAGGLIRQAGRGRVHIIDHSGLEAAACSCYGIVRALYAFEHSSVR